MLRSFTSRASGAFTPLALARTQKPGSTASETLAGNELSACLVAYEDTYISIDSGLMGICCFQKPWKFLTLETEP